MTTFDQDKHILLRDQAHKRRLTPEEYPAFEAALIEEGVSIMTVECPEWPPVPKSLLVLMFGGDAPFEGEHWTGEQPAIDASDYLARRTVTKIGREMAGPALSSKRMAYAWQVPEYDPARHILMRQWLADNAVDIVDFLRQFIPKMRKELGRDPLFEVANPHAQAESEAGGGYSPTRRALAVEDLPILQRFAQTSERYTYEAEQPVSWMRSLDGTRWEARRQYDPQRARWANHRSWINRTLGDGAWTEADRSEEGYAFGPFMELWDDGSIYLWCYRRALDFLSSNPLNINGVSVFFTPEKTGPGTVCRMAGQVDSRDMDTILAGTERAKEKADQAGQVEDETESEAGEGKRRENPDAERPHVDCVFRQRPGKPFWHPEEGADLPRRFHRASGSPLVVRTRGDRAEVRCWGDARLLDGFVLNSVVVDGFKPWNSGFRAQLSAEETDIILGRRIEEAEESQERPEPARSGTGAASAADGRPGRRDRGGAGVFSRRGGPVAAEGAEARRVAVRPRGFGQRRGGADEGGPRALPARRPQRPRPVRARHRRAQLRLRELRRAAAGEPGGEARRERLHGGVGRRPRLQRLRGRRNGRARRSCWSSRSRTTW